MRLHGVPDRDGAGEGPCAQCAVGVGVPSPVRVLGGPVGHRVLPPPRHGVVLCVGADDGLALAPRGHVGSGHPRDAHIHLEALIAVELGEGLHRPVLPEGRLGVAPDLLVEIAQALSVVVYPLEGRLLGLRELRQNSSHPLRRRSAIKHVDDQVTGRSCCMI